MEDDERRNAGDSSDESDLDENDNLTVNVYQDQVDLPPPGDKELYGWSELRNKQLRSALVGACKRMSRNAEAHFHSGLMFLRNGKGTEALKVFLHCEKLYNDRLQAAKGDPPPGLLKSIARLRYHIVQASRLDAAKITNAEEKTELLVKLQDRVLENAKSDNEKLDVWNSLALLHLLEGGAEGARDIFRAVRDRFPDYLDAINNLGLAEMSLGNEREATRCFQEVVLRDRGHVEALSNYGVILLQHGMFEHAAKIFQEALSGSEGGRVAKAGLGLHAEAEAYAREAEKSAVEAIDRSRMTMLVHSIMARRATDATRLVPELPLPAPTAAGVVSPFATGGSMAGGDSQPSRTLRPMLDVAVTRLRGLARDLNAAPASTALGSALRLRHEFSIEETGNRSFGAEAAERLVEALEKSQEDASAWTQLALLQMGSGEYASAREFAVQACARNENLPAAWNTLGVTSQLIDENEDAESAYYKTLGAVIAREIYSMDENETETNPERKVISAAGGAISATVWNNLGNLWRQQGAKFEKAQDAYEQSLLAGGEHPVVYNNLALLYISVGRLDLADQMLNNALRLDPTRECVISNRLKLKVLKKMRKAQSSS